MRLWLDRLASPIGELLLAWDEVGAVRGLGFADGEARFAQALRRAQPAAEPEAGSAPPAVAAALAAYFAGNLAALGKVPVAIAGGTPFQRAVWLALPAIGPGQTLSYGALAARLGRPRACRAVGAANGANPISLFLPCHRVIGGDGSLTGYGGGLARKRWLLEHERRYLPGGGSAEGAPQT